MDAPITPPEGSIAIERRGHVLLIGINRPAKYNGFTPPMFHQLGEAYTLLDDDPELRVGVLHAWGKHFTAGLDLPTIAPLMQRGEKAIPFGMVEPCDLGTPGLLTGDEFGAAEALRLNFVQKVVPAGQELDEALRIAEAIADQAPLAVVATRLNALKAVEQGPIAAMQEFIGTQQRLSNSEDAKEGVRSFVERRPAKFTGQ